MNVILDSSGLPRVDYRLSVGEDPVFEKITPENAYDLPYIRLVYKQRIIRTGKSFIYTLQSVEVVG